MSRLKYGQEKENTMNDPYVLKVPMDKQEKNAFMKAFKKSGFKNMSEFVRFLIRQYIAAMGTK